MGLKLLPTPYAEFKSLNKAKSEQNLNLPTHLNSKLDILYNSKELLETPIKTNDQYSKLKTNFKTNTIEESNLYQQSYQSDFSS